MKEAKTTKKKRWIWLVAGLAVLLAAAAAVLAIFLIPGQQGGNEDPAPSRAVLYWNVDRASYVEEETGMSSREASEDGLYHIRFAIDGAQVELTATDKQLVNFIDSMDLMGLVVDNDGIIVDAVAPETIATKTAEDFYVKGIDGNTVTLNSSKAMNGMDMVITLTDETAIYDVTPDAQLVGQLAQLETMDKLLVYSSSENEVTHVYITEHAVEADVYWRLERCYDTSKKVTTRQPDENGIFTIGFAHYGEHIELKCKDQELVTKIDSFATTECDVGLVLDEDGYILEIIDTALAFRGIELCYRYTVTEISDKTITATRTIPEGKEIGKSVTFDIGEDCDIFLVCDGGTTNFIGERITELQPNDQIICYSDLNGTPSLIFVVRRLVDSPLYYNLSRKYSTSAKETTREPDANGYYVFEMLCDGKIINVRTRDKALASRMDSYERYGMGLKLNGSIVEAAYSYECVCGYTVLHNRFASDVLGSIVTSLAPTSGSSINVVMNPDCKVYDLTGNYGVTKGTKTTLQKGDYFNGFRNANGEYINIYVTQRYAEGAAIYYNLSRKYDGTTQQTTREPDAEGYYVFDMLCGGKQVTVKTKSKSLASYIDSQGIRLMSLKVSGGIVKNAYSGASAASLGLISPNGNYVSSINNNKLNTYYISGDVRYESALTHELSESCKIYNVSNAYRSYKGEPTTLQPGDKIRAIMVDLKLTEIFVVEREIDSPLYWNTNRMYDSTKEETKRTPDENAYYVFELLTNRGKIVTLKTKDKDVASSVDKRASAFALYTSGSTIYRVLEAEDANGIEASVASQYDVMSINGRKINATMNKPTNAKIGDSQKLTLASNCKIFDVCKGSETFAKTTQLQLGDRIYSYINEDNQVAVCYIVKKNTRTAGPVGYCDHCGKDVWWEAYDGTHYDADVHYYLSEDQHKGSQRQTGSAEANAQQYEMIFDLNGKTLSFDKRGFLVYSTLSILDSAGGGSVIASNKTGSYGGCIMVTDGGTLNLYSGTLTVVEDARSTRGGVLSIGNGSTFNMYGGTVTGGILSDSGRGGNIYLSSSTMNLYGGTVCGGNAGSGSGGNIYVTGKNAALNIHGGTVEGGIGSGGNIYLAADTTFHMDGGSVSGDIDVCKNCSVTLSGTPVISKGNTGLRLESGVKLNLGELTQNASIVVSANGVFTEASEKADSYKAYFKPAGARDSITIQDNALLYNVVLPDYNTVDNSDLVFDEGTTVAVCPVCAEKVQWTELGADVAIQLSADSHYYLAADTTYTGTDDSFITTPTSGTACLHLNGKNLSSSTRVLQGAAGTLNVIGEGRVCGNYSGNANRGATLDMDSSAGVVNLCGGTYTKSSENTTNNIVTIWGNGGTVNLYAGAAIDGTGNTKKNLTAYNGTFNMYGGKVCGGSGTMVGTYSYSSSQNGTFNLYGGEVSGNVQARGEAFTMTGGTITGSVDVAKGTVTLSGAPVIAELKLADGLMVALGELSEGASVAINANGAFTEINEKAADYAKYFSPVSKQAKISVQNNILYCLKDLNAALDFSSGTPECPVCGVVSEWIEISQAETAEPISYTLPSGESLHYYLSADVIYSGADSAYLTAPGGNRTICLHLNGHNLTATNQRAFLGSAGVLNVIGNGVVSGNYQSGKTNVDINRSATVEINTTGANGTINLYGGTYIKAEGNTQKSVACIWQNGGMINLYDGASIVGAEGEYSVYVRTQNRNNNQAFSIYGAEISSGAVYFDGSTNATQTKGPAVLNISGGSIGSIEVIGNTTVNLSGAPLIAELKLAEGVKITLGELTDGATVTVSANGIFTEPNENAVTYAKYFTAATEGHVITAKEDNSLYCENTSQE